VAGDDAPSDFVSFATGAVSFSVVCPPGELEESVVPVGAGGAFFLESLKSVTYQPLPFRMNPVRDIILTIGPFWHESQDSGPGSDIFCIFSVI